MFLLLHLLFLSFSLVWEQLWSTRPQAIISFIILPDGYRGCVYVYVCECECVLVGFLAHIEGPASLLKAEAILSVRCNPLGDHLLHINATLPFNYCALFACVCDQLYVCVYVCKP